MRKVTSVVTAVAIITGAASAATSLHAQAPQQDSVQDEPAGQRRESRIITAAAEVSGIDKENRIVTLKTEQGQTFDVKAGPNVSLDRVRKGDPVNAQYYEEVAVELQPSAKGTPPSMTQRTVERGGVSAVQTTITAQVLSVDTVNDVVVVRAPRGTHTLYVQDPAIQAQLSKIKARDNVTVTYTQAVALALEPRK
jgi:hypothetical protein